MSWTRRIVGALGAALAAGAGLMSAVGLIGTVWGWADAVNSFAPVWLVAGWGGAGLVVLALPKGRIRTAALISAAVAVVVCGAALVFEMVRTGREAPPPANLTIVTFNRWWDSPDRPGQIAMIRNSGADLVALQEVDGLEPSLRRLTDVYPYQIYCNPDCDTAILSKRPFLASGQDPHFRVPGGMGFLWGRTTAPDGKPVTLATIHLYWPIPPWIQRMQRGHLPTMIATANPDELILVGDFNLTPWSWAMRKLDPTLRPLTRRTHGLLTFPASWPFPFFALDQVYAAPVWKTVEVRRLPRAVSDHYSVRIELRR